MNQVQFDRWKQFSLGLAKSAYPNITPARREKLMSEVADCVEWVVCNGLDGVVDWDSATYRDGKLYEYSAGTRVSDNGALAGKPCAWCATWAHAKAMREAPSTAILRLRDAKTLRDAAVNITSPQAAQELCNMADEADGLSPSSKETFTEGDVPLDGFFWSHGKRFQRIGMSSIICCTPGSRAESLDPGAPVSRIEQ